MNAKIVVLREDLPIWSGENEIVIQQVSESFDIVSEHCYAESFFVFSDNRYAIHMWSSHTTAAKD
jgi:hypothetical protein